MPVIPGDTLTCSVCPHPSQYQLLLSFKKPQPPNFRISDVKNSKHTEENKTEMPFEQREIFRGKDA